MMPIFLLAFTVQAETYHVSHERGDDANPGSQDRPFKSIQRGLDALGTGDDLVIGAGHYAESPVLENTGGTPDDYIEIRSAVGAAAVIRALDAPDPGSGFEIRDSGYVRLEGIRIDGARKHGIGIFASHHIEVLNNVTYNTGQSGIRVKTGSDILLDGNDVSRTVQLSYQESISLSYVDGFIVRNNHVHDRPRSHSLQQEGGVGPGGEGIDAKDGCRHGRIHDNIVSGIEGKLGIYVDAYATDSFDIEVYNNVVTNSGCGFALSNEAGTSTSGYLSSVKLYNNISYGNRCGIYMGNHGGDSSRIDQVRRVEDIEIYNNTIYGNGIGTGGGGIDIANPNIARLTIRNNLVFDNKGGQIRLAGGLTELPPETVIESNLVYGYAGKLPVGDNITGNPMVRDAINADFRLTETSLAVDAGMANGAPGFDHHDILRPQGNGVDIGAHEFASIPEPPNNLDVD